MNFPANPWIGLRPGRLPVAALSCAAFGAALAAPTPTAWAGFGIAQWEAGTCKEPTCNVEGHDPEAEFYTQAAGHPDFGITLFAFNARTEGVAQVPEGHVKDVRVDLPPGLAVDPEAVNTCTEAQLDKSECPPGSRVGEDEATGTVALTEALAGLLKLTLPLGTDVTVTESFPVYNMEHRPGEPARFGVEVSSTAVKLLGLESRLYLEGAISWHNEAPTGENSNVTSGDFHEFFEIKNIPTAPALVKSKLIFWGVPHEHNPAAPADAFLTMPSSLGDCTQPQTTWLHVDSWEAPGDFIAIPAETRLRNGTPITATGCSALEFNPALALATDTPQADQPDGARVDLHVPQFTTEPSRPGSPDLQSAAVTLPAGMTLNPAAAHGLQACTDEEIGIGSDNPIGCPAGSQIGSVTVDAPGIPNGTLSGGVYLGSQESQDPESGREYRIFLAAQAPSYGVGLRLEGRVQADAQTGRLTATFADDPQVPFEDFIVTFDGGPRAPLANPLSCAAALPAASLTPYSGQPPQAAAGTGFLPAAANAGAPCPSPPPFALTQSTQERSATAGGPTSFTFNLARPDGQQYLSQIDTTLPAGLIGTIPAVTLCDEAHASAGTCPPASEIGQATVTAGAGPEPYAFSGRVYLTGPFAGAPYGLAIAVPARAGPFDLGSVVARAAIDVATYTGRVLIESSLPRIVSGVPLRLRTITVAIDRSGFLRNPSNCGPLATESALTGFTPASSAGAVESLSTPFQVGDCAKLAFKPSLRALTGAKTSRIDGASIEVRIAQGPHQANLREVQMQLPERLPARLTTLRKACPAALFEAAAPPGACPSTAQVGGATVTTPALPGKLTGPVYLVSHGGEAFPDLDLILRGDGLEVVLVGHTHIARSGITTSTFETLPDVPISSAVVNLPIGEHSALSALGNVCKGALAAPTTIIAQSGAKVAQRTRIAVRGCPVTKRKKKSPWGDRHRRRGRRGRGHRHSHR
ncbi:MAG TPA: hypothetical protein VNY52_04515 [Solirubrobacteraceae bacterium]|jgi:hypothetical protein|nr:hypothetical protein [Solirubrobacteraceae bacterium]